MAIYQYTARPHTKGLNPDSSVAGLPAAEYAGKGMGDVVDPPKAPLSVNYHSAHCWTTFENKHTLQENLRRRRRRRPQPPSSVPGQSVRPSTMLKC